jgi:hypothetical protein
MTCSLFLLTQIIRYCQDTFYVIVCHADIHYFLEGFKCCKALLMSMLLFSWILRVTRVHGSRGIIECFKQASQSCCGVTTKSGSNACIRRQSNVRMLKIISAGMMTVYCADFKNHQWLGHLVRQSSTIQYVERGV